MNNINTSKQQAGFTMLEVLVAMTLGVIVLGAAIGMQISHQRGFKLTESKLNMQTNARFAYEFIASNLRELGAVGCRTVKGYYGPGIEQDLMISNYEIAFNDDTVAYADFRNGRELIGHENLEGSTVWSPTISAQFGFIGSMQDGSDAITMRGAIGRTYRVDVDLGGVDVSSGTVTLDMSNISYVALKPKHYAVLSQCASAEVFKITGSEADVKAGKIGHATGSFADDNERAGFKTIFDDRSVAELRRVAVNTYYIAENPNGVPTLYRDTDNVSDPLVEGVERMQIEYGVNSNPTTVNVPDEFHTADWVETNDQWANVVAVRLSFIMRSKDPIYENPVQQTYNLPGATIYTYSPNDRYARLVYTSTVNLRNRTTGHRT